MPIQLIATEIIKKLYKAGFCAYFTGGFVRDFLMNHPSDDIDIATNAPVDAIQKLFPKTIPVGIAFGIVIVVEQGHHFEVATFRKDRGYVDGRRPIGIEPATPEEDAQRRDFTINGMFYDPLHQKLMDYVGGQEDIKNKIIRSIGNPHERFLEDRLRMMRAVRYSTRFEFTIEPKTYQAILDHAQSLVTAVAKERIWQEFKKMSYFAHFDKGLLTLHELNLLQTIFPSLKEVQKEEIKKRVSSIPKFPKNSLAIGELLELFPNASLEEKFSICDDLKVSKEEKEFTKFLHHIQLVTWMPPDWSSHLEKIEWAYLYANKHSDLCLQIVSTHLSLSEQKKFLKIHLERKAELTKAIERIRTNKPLVKAEDLIKEGIVPGKNLGLLLKEAERLSVNRGSDNRSEIISLLKNSPLWINKNL